MSWCRRDRRCRAWPRRRGGPEPGALLDDGRLSALADDKVRAPVGEAGFEVGLALLRADAAFQAAIDNDPPDWRRRRAPSRSQSPSVPRKMGTRNRDPSKDPRFVRSPKRAGVTPAIVKATPLMVDRAADHGRLRPNRRAPVALGDLSRREPRHDRHREAESCARNGSDSQCRVEVTRDVEPGGELGRGPARSR